MGVTTSGVAAAGGLFVCVRVAEVFDGGECGGVGREEGWRGE